MTDLTKRLSDATEGARELDVLIEVALFEPDEEFVSCRANNAGTKVIYTRHDGTELTCWAYEHDPSDALAILSAKASNTGVGG